MKLIILGAILLIVVGSIPGPTVYYYRTPDPEPVKIEAVVTAYTSSVDETDSTPDITASGERTRDGIVANNCLEFGSKVVIEDKVYVVEDRMNKRYGCEHYDIWLETKDEAYEWGRRELAVIIK